MAHVVFENSVNKENSGLISVMVRLSLPKGRTRLRGQLGAGSGARSQDDDRRHSGLRGSNSPRFSVKKTQTQENSIASDDSLIRCPGSSLESCIKTCPGHTAQAYGGCVTRCSEICDQD